MKIKTAAVIPDRIVRIQDCYPISVRPFLTGSKPSLTGGHLQYPIVL
ncbi:MAG TPA: hypothetical protein VD994_07990 [Prosthecobacter sp.]|nr:hypothetical protein [Prosthecobacter sp.]